MPKVVLQCETCHKDYERWPFEAGGEAAFVLVIAKARQRETSPNQGMSEHVGIVARISMPQNATVRKKQGQKNMSFVPVTVGELITVLNCLVSNVAPHLLYSVIEKI